MRRAATMLALALLPLAAGAPAQNPQRPRRNPPPPAQVRPVAPADSTLEPMEPMGPRDPRRAQALRERVEERFGQMVKNQLQLNDDQMQRVRQTMRANQDRRRELMRREQDLRRAIGDQMQPGVAANNDSLNRMLAAASQLRVERAQSDDQMLRDLSFLTPVQRARLIFMLQRFEEQVQDIRRRSMMGPGPQRRPM